MSKFILLNSIILSMFLTATAQARGDIKATGATVATSSQTAAISFNAQGATELVIGYKPRSKMMDMSPSSMIMTITIGSAGVEVTKTTTVPEEEAKALQLLGAIEKGIPNSRMFRSMGNPVVLITTGMRHRPSDQELNELQQEIKDLIPSELLQELELLQVQKVL